MGCDKMTARTEQLRETWLSPQPYHPRFKACPHAYEMLSVTPEEREFLNRHALTIFTELANAGKPFADCLAAILLTGMHYATKLRPDSK
jgi:hypothetical protein